MAARDIFLASVPILIVLTLMLGLRWNSARAGIVGWVVAQAIAAFGFGAGWSVLIFAQLKGILLTAFVLYVIWAALLFYRITDEAGALSALGSALSRLAPDRAFQAMWIGWAFASFLEGVTGFGVPIAIVAPLLVEIGFAPLTAITTAAVGHPWAITFGSLGAPFYALLATTGYQGAEIASPAAWLLGLACFGCGAAALQVASGWRALLHNLPPLLLMGMAMAGAQLLAVRNGLWPVGGMIGGLAGLTVGLGWAYRRTRRCPRRTPLSPTAEAPAMPIIWTLFPYILLVLIVLCANLCPPLHNLLGQVVIRIEFPELVTTRGWVTPAGPGRTIEVFGHGGALLVYTSIAVYLVFRRRGYYQTSTLRQIIHGVVQRATPTSIGIAAMVGIAVTMEHAGMTHSLAEGMAHFTGAAYPFLSPFVGALGAFMTGSNTNSNLLFGAFQKRVGILIGASPLWLSAAQTAGGAIGSLFAPAKITVGCSTAGLAGEEGTALRKTLKYGSALLAVLAVAAGAVVYH